MIRGLALVIISSVLLAGCSSTEEKRDELRVMVAASMCQLAEDRAQELSDDLDVTVVCGGSADLISQIDAGAQADILITANLQTAETVVERGQGTIVSTIATSEMVLVTPAGNPGYITGFDDSLNGSKFVMCAPQVPCGQVTTDLAALNSLSLQPVSEEQSVTDVLGKVTSGQADAGTVYRTDAKAAGDAVEILDIPHASEVPNTYPLLVIGRDEPTETDQLWIDAFTTGAGREAMIEAGFSVTP